MPIYNFEGRRERTGELVKGMREAVSHAALGQDLLSEDILLTHFEEKQQRLRSGGILAALSQRVSIIERTLFARYFSLMLRAGLDIKKALSALGEQSTSKALKNALNTIYHDVDRGRTLADSLQAFPSIFSPLFVGFVRIGETTGRLQETFAILADQLQKEYELRRAVRGALMYPAVILVALVAVGFAMLTFVVPKLAEVFEGFNVQLPLPTRILLGLGRFFGSYWYLVLVGLLLLVGGGWLLWRYKPAKDRFMRGLLYVPIFGTIVQKVNLARFSRNLSSLLNSGVAFTEALGLLSRNTPHPTYADIFTAALQHVKQGKTLSSFLSQFKRAFPPIVVNVVRIGEETGDLDTVLKETANFYEAEVSETMKNFASILEPILMIVIGVAVGALAISVISPIYNLVNVI